MISGPHLYSYKLSSFENPHLHLQRLCASCWWLVYCLFTYILVYLKINSIVHQYACMRETHLPKNSHPPQNFHLSSLLLFGILTAILKAANVSDHVILYLLYCLNSMGVPSQQASMLLTSNNERKTQCSRLINNIYAVLFFHSVPVSCFTRYTPSEDIVSTLQGVSVDWPNTWEHTQWLKFLERASRTVYRMIHHGCMGSA